MQTAMRRTESLTGGYNRYLFAVSDDGQTMVEFHISVQPDAVTAAVHEYWLRKGLEPPVEGTEFNPDQQMDNYVAQQDGSTPAREVYDDWVVQGMDDDVLWAFARRLLDAAQSRRVNAKETLATIQDTFPHLTLDQLRRMTEELK